MSSIDPVTPGSVPAVDRPDARTRKDRKRKPRDEPPAPGESSGGRIVPSEDAERDDEGPYGEVDVYVSFDVHG